MKERQQKQAKYFNRSTRDLKPLEEGDTVRMKPFIKGRKEWKKGIVLERLDQRSYEVQTDDGTYRRNRVHLKQTNEPFEPKLEFNTPESEIPVKFENTNAQSVSPSTPMLREPERVHQPSPVKEPNYSPVRTRSGRIIRTPSYLNDYAT